MLFRSGQDKPSILADGFEAFLGALYLDQGFDVAYQFFIRMMEAIGLDELSFEQYMDSKTLLQEMVQKSKHELPEYAVVRMEGPDHQKTFFVSVSVMLKEQIFESIGEGSSKKVAEQNAAENVLKAIHASSILS